MEQKPKCALCKVKPVKRACHIKDGLGTIECPTKTKAELIKHATN